ncbi:molecular chaperone DnaJ [Halopseudomonas pelagia]|uniref:molecular chaperone DnaJ n=1 Tax=Halopseudomonas pelagia TaxID=553151 RepID=UPI00039A1B46|nr:molecular chaperone DnaJ [Halopseudomonas pelagia]
MGLLLIVLIIIGVIGWFWVRSLPAPQRRAALVMLLLLGVLLIMVVLALSGRFYLVLALLAGLLPVIKRLVPGLVMGGLLRGTKMPGSRGQPSAGNQSKVTSQVLEMTLDHDSGDMAGSVLSGPLAGRALTDLSEGEFIQLLHYCRETDEDSARLLETYLDRRFGDSWRDDDTADQDGQPGRAQGQQRSGALTEQEALEVLGLQAGASREEVIEAHRRMMQKMHPDRGGSDYLAALINQAKDVLLG